MIDKEQVKLDIIKKIDISEKLDENEIEKAIIKVLRKEHNKNYICMEEYQKLIHYFNNCFTKLDMLQDLIDDKSITEIMINGCDNIFVERNGVISKSDTHISSQAKLEDMIQQMVGEVNRTVNTLSPIVDARLKDGSRINVVLPPVANNGPIVTIRKFPERKLTIQDLLDFKAITREVADFLKKLVRSRYNIFVSGGTGSGKTTFLNVLSDFIPEDERVIVIEDNLELQITKIPNIVRLEARQSNTEGEGEINIRDLIKASLRMRPDRIIVGEVRGSEAVDMLQAMNTGHDGSLSTGHSNSPKDMLARLETMILMGTEIPLEAVDRQIGSGIDIIVHLGRMRDKTRKVLEIDEVLGFEQGKIMLSTLYKFVEEKNDEDKKVKGKLEKINELKNFTKLQSAGLCV